MMVRNRNSKRKAASHIGESARSSESRESDPEIEGLIKTFAKCKWFNVSKGYGFVALEDPSRAIEVVSTDKPPPDVFVYQSAIKMPGFRSLREGERVEVWFKKSDKGLEAVKVAGPDGSDCVGSGKKKKKAADRCYNCEVRGHHAKECKLPPLPKRCHHCKSVDHLVADCTLKREKTSVSSQSENNFSSSTPDDQRATDHVVSSQQKPESSQDKENG